MTILCLNLFSIKGDTSEVYRGDRTKEEIVGFALRMASAPVPHLDAANLNSKIKLHKLMFLYAGNKEGELWVSERYQKVFMSQFHSNLYI